MRPVLRILDANANRAREAMRVLEEAARFLLDDPALAAGCKQLRHDFAAAIEPFQHQIHHRDTPGDVGTRLTTAREGRRDSVAQVAAAAAKRLSESLRALEEYGKLLRDLPGASRFPELIEQLRYRAYDLEARLLQALGRGGPRQWRLCLLLTEGLCRHHPWTDVLDAALRAGADCIQVREKTMEAGPLRDRVAQVVTRVERRAAVIVNDRPDVALAAGADGVHLGQTDLGPADVRRLAGQQLIVGVSTSTLDQARRAHDDGADYCGVGPMFPTTTKAKKALAGPAYLRDYLAWDPGERLPHLAIGGITPANADTLWDIGCQGVAVSSAICAAQQPYDTACAILARSCATTVTAPTA